MQFSQSPLFNPFGAVSNPPWTLPSYPWHQFSPYLTFEIPNPQLPTAPINDVPAQNYSYNYSTAVEPLHDAQHLAFPNIASLDGVYMIIVHRLL